MAKSPDAITVGDVLKSVENVKSSPRPRPDDAFGEIWRRVDAAVSDVLDQTTFGDLARSWQEKNAKYVPTWDI